MKIKKKANVAILLTGGSGIRFGSEKQFALALGKPLMSFALEELGKSELIDEIFIVAKKETIEKTKQIALTYGNKKVKAIISGGKTRQESGYIALKYLKEYGLSDDSIVLIQDGDRPNLNQQLIKENIESARINKAVVTAIKVTNSIFVSSNGYEVNKYLNRNEIYIAQTPQTFLFSLIYKAHKKGNKKQSEGITDDASLVKQLKKDVAIVKGNEKNIKINYPKDLQLFEKMKGEELP
ncbi:MAG TPA: 2-C-methyl-D-erythritol 4-phosphate cytidylyltransferase [Firmicutes bacterium]|nr:2-C-methyl-D-erythritol 4-phosphate cytidylyltransferase [Bacillota bacterium]HBM70378.1 2-C-methyl-D-erythritol 4-phosphate cytidylyltransferase [Bacillota bacterium]HBX25487.1 2-C-methyl-D-erythritol 4-phosphate cytidylyltransferase [Bacillota bacterium]